MSENIEKIKFLARLSGHLGLHCCMSEDYFNDYFLYEKYSNILCEYFNQEFRFWWNPEKFNWSNINSLVVYCSKHFKIWWDPERFEYHDLSIELLPEYCKKHFNIWFPYIKQKDPVNQRFLVKLIMNCNDKFEVWKELTIFKDRVEYKNIFETLCNSKIPFDKWWDKRFSKYLFSADVISIFFKNFKDHIKVWLFDILKHNDSEYVKLLLCFLENVDTETFEIIKMKSKLFND